MAKFLVLYMAPAASIEEWMKTDPEMRKEQEAKMMSDWDAWMDAHPMVSKAQTAGVGKTKRVSAQGIEDAKNDIMLYSLIEADSHEAAAELFKDHPHFGITGATIQVSPVNPLSGN